MTLSYPTSMGSVLKFRLYLSYSPSPVTCLSSGDVEETSSSASGSMATVFASSPSAWRRDASFGRRPRVAPFPSRLRSCRCSLKGSTGDTSREHGHSRARSDHSAYFPVFIGILWMHDVLIDAILRLWIALLFRIWTAWIATRW